MRLKKVTDCPTPTKEEVKGGIKRKTPKIHAAQTRCRCNKTNYKLSMWQKLTGWQTRTTPMIVG